MDQFLHCGLFTTIMMVVGGVIGSVLLTGISHVGVRLGGLVQNIFTIAKVAAMMLLVLGAFSRSANLPLLSQP